MSLLITDLDNTLYNWVDFFGNSFRGMVHALSRKMNIEENELKAEINNIYKEAGTLEYSFVIQKLPYIENYSGQERNAIIDFGKKVFSIVRAKNLNAYCGVQNTLEQLTINGVSIVAVTNAPAYFAEARLKQLKLDKYFIGLAALENTSILEDEFTTDIIEKNKKGSYQSKHIRYRWELSKEEIKPNPFAYLQVINDLKFSHKNTYVVGDSIFKDLNPASEIGAISIWAKYGVEFEKKNFDTLLEMTHWDNSKIKNTYEEKTIRPNYTIENYNELLEIVKTPQLQLF